MSENLRVAVWHDLPSGGGRRALTSHVEGLVRLGHDVQVWSTPQSVGPLSLARDVVNSVSQITVPVSEVATRGKLATAWSKLDLTRSTTLVETVREHLQVFATQVRQWKPDVVFANSSERLGAAPVASSVPEIPSVLYLQEPMRMSYEDLGNPLWRAASREGRGLSRTRAATADLIAGQRQRLLARDEWEAVADFDTVLVNSIFSRETLRRVFGIGATVCYLGVDDAVFADLGRKRAPFFLSVGQFEAHKRPLLVVEALAKMTRPLPLVWVGNRVNESLHAEVQEVAASADVEVHLRRGISDHDLVELYNTCCANVYAPVLEPFGYTPIEAALCGAPTIGVAEGGLRETVEHNVTGLLADPDANSLASAMDRMTQEPSLAERLGANAREHALATFPVADSQRRLAHHLKAAVDRRGGVR